MRSSILLKLLLASFAIVGLAVLIYFSKGYFKPLKPQSVVDTLNFSPTNVEWKTYRNDEYGFIIQYPPGWFAQKYISTTGPTDGFQLLFDRKPIPEKMEALIHGWPELTIEIKEKPWNFDMLRRRASGNETEVGGVKYNIENYASTTFAGIPAATIVSLSEMLPASGPDTSVYFNYKDYGWMIRHPNTNYQGNHDPFYDKILSTLKFLNHEQRVLVSGWKEYRNEDYHFSLSYPPESILEEGMEFGYAFNVFFFSDMYGKIGILPKGERDFGFPGKQSTIRMTKITNYDAKWEEYELGGEKRLILVRFQTFPQSWNKDHRIQIETTKHGLSTIHQILSTFRFTDQ